MKKYLYGLAVAAAMAAPLSAEELYVRNRAFGDAYFVSGTTYVPAGSFLKALDVAWADSGSVVNLGSGESPETAFDSETVTVKHGDKTLDLAGMMRGGKLYVPAKALATFVGYTVIANPDTGIIDVVKSRDYNATDSAAEKDVAAAQQASKDAIKATREARQAKEKAYSEARAKAEGETEEAAEEVEAAEGDAAAVAAKPAEAAPAEAAPAAAGAEEPKEPPKANLVVLSSEASPNYYTGEVVFRAVIQNQGFAPAEGISAAFNATGPDGRVWVSKTLYNPPIAVDGRWEITETYRHRAASAMPRGTFEVKVTPKFTSGAVAEKK